MNIPSTQDEIAVYCEFIYSQYLKHTIKNPHHENVKIENFIVRYRTKNSIHHLLIQLNKLESLGVLHVLEEPITRHSGNNIFVGDIILIILNSSQFHKWATEIGCTENKLHQYSKLGK